MLNGTCKTNYHDRLRLIWYVRATQMHITRIDPLTAQQTIVATAIPRITDQFHSLDQVGWYGSAFFLTLAAFQAAWGKAYRYFSLKYTFLVSVFLFEIGSLICGEAYQSSM